MHEQQTIYIPFSVSALFSALPVVIARINKRLHTSAVIKYANSHVWWSTKMKLKWYHDYKISSLEWILACHLPDNGIATGNQLIVSGLQIGTKKSAEKPGVIILCKTIGKQ